MLRIHKICKHLWFCRLGIKSMVLESSDSLRITGFAFLVWTNAWKALEALRIDDSIRQQHKQLHGYTKTTISFILFFRIQKVIFACLCYVTVIF